MTSEAAGTVCIGDEITSLDSKAKGPALIPLEALRRHVCILGTTGSGKSNCAKVICRELNRLGVPTVVLDRTGEYAEAFAADAGVKILTPGRNLVTPIFKLTEKRGRADISSQIEDWVSLLDHFNHVSNSAGLSPLQARVLREVLWKHYEGTTRTLTISGPHIDTPGLRKARDQSQWMAGKHRGPRLEALADDRRGGGRSSRPELRCLRH